MNTVLRFCEMGLVDKLLFGSHTPLFIPLSAVARVVIDLDAAAATKILGGNAARVLGLEGGKDF